MTRSPDVRPAFLNLARIRMPVGALTSIGHRVSGVVLAASVPIGLFLLGRSLRDAQGFADVDALLRQLGVKAGAVVVCWALAHHVLAGVRHLLSDVDIGSRLRTARRSAWLVNVGAVLLAVVAAGALV